MLVDANLLLYATDSTSPFHQRAAKWLESVLNGPARVALPWQVLSAFLRISTHPRAWNQPLDPILAVEQVHAWLAVRTTWTPEPGPGYGRILLDLIATHQARGNLITDVQLAALAVEHGLTIYSADSDFARFSTVGWVNPLQA